MYQTPQKMNLLTADLLKLGSIQQVQLLTMKLHSKQAIWQTDLVSHIILALAQILFRY